MSDPRKGWTREKVASYLGVSVQTVHRLRAAGKLPGYMQGRYLRFDPALVRELKRQREMAVPA